MALVLLLLFPNIDNLGNVHPDTFWWDYTIGNVRERPFSEIWTDLSDPIMANMLKTSMTDASAPGPSVETILHASLPHKFVDHTHADAVVTITNTAEGRARIEEIYGEQVVIIPYVMPGPQRYW